jgi:hypothetical protein
MQCIKEYMGGYHLAFTDVSPAWTPPVGQRELLKNRYRQTQCRWVRLSGRDACRRADLTINGDSFIQAEGVGERGVIFVAVCKRQLIVLSLQAFRLRIPPARETLLTVGPQALAWLVFCERCVRAAEYSELSSHLSDDR